MRTLAEFKRTLTEPNVKLTLIKYLDSKTNADKPHRYLNKIRSVSKIQTNGVYLLDPETKQKSWLDYGKATQWAFTDNTATFTDEYITLIYLVEKEE